jgi:hypothetical protein
MVAVFREDGLDVAAEVDFSGGESGSGEQRDEDEQTRESKRGGGHGKTLASRRVFRNHANA